MKADIITVPEHCVVIKNWFQANEIEEIFVELDGVNKMMVRDGETVRAAKSEDGSFLKKGKGIFLDDIYERENRDSSAVLKYTSRIFDRNLVFALSQECSYFEQIGKSTLDFTLINYYEGGDEYKQHSDESIYTACFYLWKEPKKFSGGDFYLRDTLIPVENNMMILFPGFVKHSATMVKMINDEKTHGFGRWSIVKFINYKN